MFQTWDKAVCTIINFYQTTNHHIWLPYECDRGQEFKNIMSSTTHHNFDLLPHTTEKQWHSCTVLYTKCLTRLYYMCYNTKYILTSTLFLKLIYSLKHFSGLPFNFFGGREVSSAGDGLLLMLFIAGIWDLYSNSCCCCFFFVMFSLCIFALMCTFHTASLCTTVLQRMHVLSLIHI